MMTDQEFDAYRENYAGLHRFAERYRADAALRERLAGGDYADLHMPVPEGTEIRIVSETPDTYYFMMPDDPNAVLRDQALMSVTGGTGTISTAGTVSSIPSCISSGSTVGSATNA